MGERVVENKPGGERDDARHARGEVGNAIAEHLLRRSASRSWVESPRDIAEELGVPYSTVTAQLRRLVDRGQVIHPYLANHFAMRFCHEFRVGIEASGEMFSRLYGERGREVEFSGPGRSEAPVGGESEPLARFVEDIVREISEHPHCRDHLIVLDAVFLLGAPGRDLELHVVTDDGAFSLSHCITEVLAGNPCVRSTTTWTVMWRSQFGARSGEWANAH